MFGFCFGPLTFFLSPSNRVDATEWNNIKMTYFSVEKWKREWKKKKRWNMFMLCLWINFNAFKQKFITTITLCLIPLMIMVKFNLVTIKTNRTTHTFSVFFFPSVTSMINGCHSLFALWNIINESSIWLWHTKQEGKLELNSFLISSINLKCRNVQLVLLIPFLSFFSRFVNQFDLNEISDALKHT